MDNRIALDKWENAHYARIMSRDQLLAEIEAFLVRHNMRPTRFGLKAMNDGKFVFMLREGVDIRLSSVDRVRKFMADWEATKNSGRPNEGASRAA